MEFRNPPVGVTGCLSHPAWAGVPSLSWGWYVVPGPPRGLRDNAPQESGCQGSHVGLARGKGLSGGGLGRTG